MSATLGRRHTRVPAAGVVLVCVLALSFSFAAPGAAAKTASPCGAVADHQTDLLVGETADVAAQLVPVKGYCYADVSEGEAQAVVDQLQATNDEKDEFFFSAVSLHSVLSNRAADNTAHGSLGPELGFLTLIAFGPQFAPPAGGDEMMARSAVSGDLVGRFSVAGTKVFVFEDASSPDSRFYFTWVRHGVQSSFDGNKRAPMEQWVRKHLKQPVLVGTETTALSAALVPVPGYAYANFGADEVTSAYVTAPLGDVPSSTHQVVDAEHTIGGVVLSEVPGTMTTAEYAAALQQGALQTATPLGTTDIGGTPVARFTTADGDYYVWVRDGIAGLGMTALVEHFEPFLEGFLS